MHIYIYMVCGFNHFLIFHNIWDNPSIDSYFSDGVETTNQLLSYGVKRLAWLSRGVIQAIWMTWNGQIFRESSQNGGKFQVNIQVSDQLVSSSYGKFHVGPRPSNECSKGLVGWCLVRGLLSSGKMLAIIPLYLLVWESLSGPTCRYFLEQQVGFWTLREKS